MVLMARKSPQVRVVLVGAIAFFLLALTLTLHRHFNFYSSYDQGIFNQVFWNGVHGRFFQSSLSSQLSTNVVHNGEVPAVYYHRLGQHFTPALLLWLPIYALFPFPATLTVLQVTLVTAAGLVLYVLARQYLQPTVSAIITLSFYGANAIVGPTLANFHDICQLPLFMFGILLAMEKRWWWLFGVLSAFILAVREDGGISLFGVGFYLIVSRRYPRLGLAVCTLSFAYMVLLTNAIMPLFSEDISRRFMIERFGQYADGEEASTVEIIWGIVSNPLRLVVELFSPFFGTIRYLISHWLPFAFVPAASPAAWAIAGFPLLKLFLGKGESVLAINIRYAMTVVPGMCYGAILWWKGRETLLDTPLREFVFKPFYLLRSLTVSPKIIDWVINWWEQHPKWLKISMRRFWTICLCISLFFSFTSNPNRTLSFIIPDSIQPWVYVPLPRQWEHATAIRSLLKQIPPDASVSATTFIVPHLSGRREIIRFPSLKFRNDRRQVVKVDYAIADIWQLQQYQAAFRGDRQTLQDSLSTIKWVTSDREYGMIDLKDGVVLLKKGATSKPEALSQWKSIVNSQ
jgi:uncharacterized membrane protein